MSITKMVTLDGTEITEHGKKFSDNESISASDVELDSGINKRYIRKNKKVFNLSFTYLPNLAAYTVDGRAGRDFLKSLAQKRGTISLVTKLSPESSDESFTVYATSYSETLIKRDVENRCAYYDVSMGFEEV